MSISKFHPQVVENLQNAQITALTPEQELFFSKIREGKNYIIKQAKETGISRFIAWSTLFKVPSPEEGSPRAIVICPNDDEAKIMYEEIKAISKRMDLTIDLVHEKGNQLKQRNDIFDGTEIVVATPKRFYDLYIQNGVNLNMVRYFVFDQAEQVFVNHNVGYMLRISESLPKCQLIVNCHQVTSKIEHFVNQAPFIFTEIEMESED